MEEGVRANERDVEGARKYQLTGRAGRMLFKKCSGNCILKKGQRDK